MTITPYLKIYFLRRSAVVLEMAAEEQEQEQEEEEGAIADFCSFVSYFGEFVNVENSNLIGFEKFSRLSYL